MAIIERRADDGSPRYLVRERDAVGRWFPARTFERKRDAERHQRDLKSSRDNGTAAAPREVRIMTLAEFFESWSRGRVHKVSVGWHASIERMARIYVLPMIGNLKLSDVRPPHIGEVLGAMAKLGLSPQTVLHVYNILHRMFDDAVEYYGFLDRSPVRRQDRPSVPRRERSFLTPEESWKLLRAVADHYLGPAVWIGILAGLRPSEIQALRWEAVDFDKKHILIRAAFKRAIGIIEPYPKQGDWGMAPMPAALVAYLEGRHDGKAGSAFVAPGLMGGMLDYRKMFFGLRRLCKETGVRVVTPHELRHSCTEMWFSMGASLEDVRRVLNHKSGSPHLMVEGYKIT